MVEKHPYKPFVPRKAKYLILGSFPAKPSDRSNWYYINPRNQFWIILEKVYRYELSTIESKTDLLGKLGMAITDIIYSCERERNSNLDTNLVIIKFNTKSILKILKENDIEKIYFTSRFVEIKFKELFIKYIRKNPNIELVYLPSPSPRYAAMNIREKIRIYKELLPRKIVILNYAKVLNTN